MSARPSPPTGPAWLRWLPPVPPADILLIAVPFLALQLFMLSLAGRAALVLPLVVAVILALLWVPGLAVAVLVACTIAFEGSDETILVGGSAPFFYRVLPVHVALVDLVVLVCILALAVDVARRRRITGLGPYTLPCLLFLCAVVSGLVTGLANESEGLRPLYQFRTLLLLPLTMLLVMNALEHRRRATWLLVGLVAGALLKGVDGTVRLAHGGGAQVAKVGGQVLTFIEPTTNWLMLLFLLSLIAMVVLRQRIPRLLLLGSPLVAVALTFSFRRSFWLAALLALAVVVLIPPGARVKRLSITVACLAGLVAALIGFAGSGASTSLLNRALTLQSEPIFHARVDAYRAAERNNVVAELVDHPVSGLGLGVDWRARQPLPARLHFAQAYTHNGLLWFYLKTGLLGALAYLSIMGAALLTAFRVFRSHPDRRFAAVGLGAFAGLLGWLVVELEFAWVGVNIRFTIFFGVLLAWLATLARRAHEPHPR